MLRKFYRYVKWQPCTRCHSPGPSDAAHVQVFLSEKTGLLMPRSHKTIAAYACIPLCKPCHLELHEIGERQFEEINDLNYARTVASLLARHFVDGRTE